MKRLVVLTGAGISAESGLKTFRDSDGLWEGYNIEDVATPQAWARNPELVLEFYNHRRSGVAQASPNKAHQILADLQEDFDVHIITQNIDDLHERGGSNNVMHLHGEIFKMRSSNDPTLIYEVRGDIMPGDLAQDGHQLRPHIVWFGEEVPMIEHAAALAASADLFAVIGTSLVVYPAGGLVHAVPRGIPMFLIDKKVPSLPPLQHLTIIEQPATSGVETLREVLVNKYK
jgi:NAD-dependent deacetylase